MEETLLQKFPQESEKRINGYLKVPKSIIPNNENNGMSNAVIM